ncbi:MAG: glycerol kinase GlpK [bacterium]
MSGPGHILAVDQGTTSSRAIIFSRDGAVQASAQREFAQHYPEPGWVEHDASEIWSTQAGVISEAAARAGLRGGDLAAIGITNQRETTVVWDRSTGEPIAPAIVWQDRRTADLCDELKQAGHADIIAEKTGLFVDAYFSGPKLRWILDHVEDARRRAEAGDLAFGTIDCWLMWNLSGGLLHITDATNASRTMLYNIHEGRWDSDLLELLQVPPEVLPEVRSSSEIYGETDADLFATPIPLAGIAGDQQAALFGQMCLEEGMVKNTYGTGGFMVLNTGERAAASRNRLLTTIGWQREGKVTYALEGSVFIAGGVVQWLRDGLGIISSPSEVERLANSVPDNGGVYLVPAFAGLGAPHWDPFARGTIIGITRGTEAGHIARAALEAIAYQTFDVLEAMQDDAGMAIKELRVDGGAAVDDTLMQFQADLMGIPAVRPTTLETTALGAAYLAGLAVGFWEGTDELQAQWEADHIFEPSMASGRAEELLADWHRAVERARDWAQHRPAASRND